MALATEKSLFLHIPKTGGWWIRYAFKLNNIITEEVGEEHAFFPFLSDMRDDDFYKNRKIFAFVRHPVTWYQSRWTFRMKTGWKSQHPLDYNCASNDFKTFVKRCLDYEPSGWVTKEYGIYIDNVPGSISYVGKTETMKEDFIKFANISGELIDTCILDGIPKVNKSLLDSKDSRYWAKYDENLLEEVLTAEKSIISRYYKDYVIDPKALL